MEPLVLTAEEHAAAEAGTLTQIRRRFDPKAFRVRLPAPVRSDPSPFSTTTDRNASAGERDARLGRAGAVSVTSDEGETLGVRPGEFHFVCPFIEGDTHLVDYGRGRGRFWTIAPRNRTLRAGDVTLDVIAVRVEPSPGTIDLGTPEWVLDVTVTTPRHAA